MGGMCITCGEKDNCISQSWSGSLEGIYLLEDLGVDGRIISK
jgi:hypothetical protein